MRGFIKLDVKEIGEVIISLNVIAYIEDRGEKGSKIFINSHRGELATIFYTTRPFIEVESLIANASE